ncbi:MAG: VOC family protein [Pseudomonadota bacterium]
MKQIAKHARLLQEEREPPPSLHGFHHVAYRCRCAKETVEFYEHALGATFELAISEDHVPSTGEANPYMHVFLNIGGDNVLAFFELPQSPSMGRDENTPAWVQHIALRVANLQALGAAKAHLESLAIEVLGPVDHGIFRSIYFHDPNGHRLELAADVGDEAQRQRLRAVARPMLDEWHTTGKAPRHAAWVHDNKPHRDPTPT